MAVRIESPEGEEALTEFLLFRDRVYRDRPAAWRTFLPVELPLLTGESPFARGRELRPFVARAGGEILARALACVDEHYLRHWNDRVGHELMFEALPDTREAVRALLDAASAWLGERGMEAARVGFGNGDFPFVVDAYEPLPPVLLRHNPPYYHGLLKDAGFETEQGWVDYKIAVRPELVARWESALEGARRAGFRIVPLRELAPAERVRHMTAVFNEAFRRHWGIVPVTEDENAFLFRVLKPTGFLDTSVIAFERDEAVGELFVAPEMTAVAAIQPGYEIPPAERLNTLGIGVRERARGRGVNLAMAAHAFLELVRRGATHVSYTLVLDDNWPSRRTGEKLGGTVCANYLTYRRALRR
jgi:hypothetical protein